MPQVRGVFFFFFLFLEAERLALDVEMDQDIQLLTWLPTGKKTDIETAGILTYVTATGSGLLGCT